MKKIDILVGENAYETVVHFSKSLKVALGKLGVQTRLFWVGDGHFFHAFYEIMNDPPDMTCSFSDISMGKKPLGDLWQIPHLSLLVDPPIYFLHQLKSQFGWISCVDEKDCEFVRKLHFDRVFFLPHAADASLKTAIDHERTYEAVFFGTCIDYEAVAALWPKAEKGLLLTASKRVLSDKGISIAETLLDLGVSAYDLPRLHSEVDHYTRGKERIELIRSLKESQVHIWGNGPWKKYFPNHAVNPAIGFDQTLEVMKQSKVVLNSSPRFKSGAHERIFYALLCGASVYTAENSYLSAQLPEIFTYRLGEWEPPSFKDWRQKAQLGQNQVLASHTWDVRASHLLQTLKLQKM